MDPYNTLLEAADRHAAEIFDLLETVVQIGAPTFHEKRRSDFLLGWIREQIDVPHGQDDDGNLWIDLSRGAASVHLLDAHIDTVFSHVDVPLRKTPSQWHAPGVFDNTVTAVTLLIWARAIAASGGNAPFLVTLSVGEEGEGNLLGAHRMAAQFKERARDAVALDLSLDRASRISVGSRRYEMTFEATGGHSWGDFGQPNAIHEAARWIGLLEKAFPWRRGERSFNIGTIEGGTGINVIAAQARFKLDIRSIDPAFLDTFQAWLEQECARQSPGSPFTITSRLIGYRPAGSLPATHPLVDLITETQGDLGLPCEWAAYSTNGNAFIAAGIPTVVTGLARGAGIHTEAEYLTLDSVPTGWRKLVLLTQKLAAL
ncbi:MAG TPA: M20/M25/M40 family metallo-hydrolase [Chthoniobacteraceae bacterium]|nr:M20/M25/M40 family metallo-hydrolase [Chthoniobacteraceae bacterium]